MKKVIKAGAFGAILTAVMMLSACGKTYPAKSEEDVLELLDGWGIEVSGECSAKTITIPENFGDVYEKYNELQKSQGFDLSRYRSREAEVWTYDAVAADGEHLDNSEVHIIICDGEVIGGDLSSPALDGGMVGLIHSS